MSMASFIGSFRRISLIPLFLTCAWGQTENIFMTDDPDWYRLLMDSVSSGTARLQYRTGTDLPFSQRINVDISSRVTLRMYNQAGPEKSYETKEHIDRMSLVGRYFGEWLCLPPSELSVCTFFCLWIRSV